MPSRRQFTVVRRHRNGSYTHPPPAPRPAVDPGPPVSRAGATGAYAATVNGMSTRWRIAGFVLAAIAFIGTLLSPRHSLTVPPIVEAAVAAVVVFIAVWLYEGILIAVRWIWRKLAN